MSRFRWYVLFGPGLLGIVSLVACAEPLDKEMHQAQGAIDAARAVGAETYAPDEFKAAVDALTHAQDAVAQRDYRLALNHALDSRERAQAAAKQAADQQAAQRSAAERRLTEATALLAIANERLSAATAARIPRRSLTQPRAGIDAAQITLQKAGTQVAGGNYAESQRQLADAEAQLRAAMTQVDALMAGRGGRPRR